MKKLIIVSAVAVIVTQYAYAEQFACLDNNDCPQQEYCFEGLCNKDSDPTYPPSFHFASGKIGDQCTYNRHCVSGACTCNAGFPNCLGNCIEDCSGGCSDCASTAWSANGIGYETRQYAICDCKTCNKSIQYRCASGYYGTTTNGESGCLRCPVSGGIYGSSDAGSTDISACYIPSTAIMSFSDAYGSGTMQFQENCYYTK